MSDPGVDIFLASFNRPERLCAMVESVVATGYPARVLVCAGDPGTVAQCESLAARLGGVVECVYSTRANTRIGCTAPLNHVVRSLVRRDALFCTDDCLFEPDSLRIAMATLYERFSDGDGVVGLAQGNLGDDQSYDLAFPLMGRTFIERFARVPSAFTDGIGHGTPGDLFWPGYFHLFNDAEIGQTIKCLGNWVFEPRARLRHFHPCTGAAEDETFRRGLTRFVDDASAWVARRMRGELWGIDAPVAVDATVTCTTAGGR